MDEWQPTSLLQLVQNRTARVVHHMAMPDKTPESRALPLVLGEREFAGSMITLDAGLTHPKLAQHILAHHGHYLRQRTSDVCIRGCTPC